MGLGMKMHKAFSKLGNKVSNAASKIGQKTSNVIKNVDNRAGKIINNADKFAGKVIDKSGGVTNYLKTTARIGNNIARGLDIIAGDIPVVGKFAGLAREGAQMANQGARKLDKIRDSAHEKREEYRANLDIERNNIRKKLEKANNEAVDKVQKFV